MPAIWQHTVKFFSIQGFHREIKIPIQGSCPWGLVSLAGQTLAHGERVWYFTVGRLVLLESVLFIVGGLLEINVLILHCRKASLNKLLAH